MKKTLTFLIICFSFTMWPPPKSSAQSDSTITKKDVLILATKDSTLSVKIDSQIHTVKKQINKIVNSKPNRIIKFRTLIKRRVRTDSFYVYIDTCFSKNTFVKYPVHDTIWLQKEEIRQSFFKRIFGKKKIRKDEIKVIQ